MAGNTAEALRRIEENKRTRSKILDLGSLGLTELPDELWDCIWLEELNLGRSYYWNEEKQDWTWDYNRDELVRNELFKLPPAIVNCKQLSSLFLDSTVITDLNPLSKLSQLKSLNLYCTCVKDVSALSSLSSLQSLDLSSTEVGDMSPLSSLSSLQSLDLSSTEVSDMSPLSSLSSLQSLDLGSTKVRNVSALSSLSSLQSLRLGWTEVSDVSALSSLSSLQSLDLCYTKVRDLSALSSLSSLQNLDLSSNQVRDLNPLSSLSNLQSLDLGYTNVRDLSALSSLSSLQSLDLHSTSINDLSALSGLSNLQSLDLFNTPVKDVSTLRGLSNLQGLYLSETKVSDVNALSNLSSLQNLDLSRTRVRDVSALSSLSNLQRLDLSYTKVSDVRALSGLSNLSSLNLSSTWVRDVSDLDSLSSLQSLNLKYTHVSNVSPLGDLPNLQRLDLSYTKVSDVRVLSGLLALQSLALNNIPIPYIPIELLFLPQLKELNLEDTQCLNLPPELTHEKNALLDLRNYYTELQKNAYTSYQAKLITLGNGRVGKTSLLKTLFQLDLFDPQEDSTHGIRLFRTSVPLPQKQATAQLALWDFGGQELYHATHRIFMKSRALYFLIWDTHTEQNLGEESVNIQGKTYISRNLPLSYWLGNIRALSQDAKIIVVCNKADAGEEHFPTKLHDLQSQYLISSFLSVSAKTAYNLPSLYQRVQELLAQMPEMGMLLPLSWKKVQDKLADLQSQPYIHLATYHAICAEEGLSKGSAITLLRFLHHSGFLFWHEEYLEDQIVLDQKWSLDAIYTLLDHNSWYEVLKGNALRKHSVLAKCWSTYTTEQVQLFLEIMQSCELALIIGEGNDPDPTYLIPEFLPDNPTTAVAYTWEGATSPVYHLRFKHQFFHAALAQRFIVRSAKLAESYDLLWRTGILLKADNTLARIQIYPESGRIEIQLRGTQPALLIERLKNEIIKIQEVKGKVDFLLSLSRLPNEWVTLKQVQQQLQKGKTHIASTTGEVLKLAPFRTLIHTHQGEERDKPLDLKELADRESGAQLLQKPEVFSLMDFKAIAKTKLMDDIEKTLQYLQEKIQPASSAFDELILLNGQWNGLKRQDRAGILSQNDNQLNENQIRSRILSLINDLQESDVKG